MPTLRDLLPSYSELSTQAQQDLILRLRLARKTRPERSTTKSKKPMAKPVQQPAVTKTGNTRILAESFLRLAQLPDEIKQEVLARMGLAGV